MRPSARCRVHCRPPFVCQRPPPVPCVDSLRAARGVRSPRAVCVLRCPSLPSRLLCVWSDHGPMSFVARSGSAPRSARPHTQPRPRRDQHATATARHRPSRWLDGSTHGGRHEHRQRDGQHARPDTGVSDTANTCLDICSPFSPDPHDWPPSLMQQRKFTRSKSMSCALDRPSSLFVLVHACRLCFAAVRAAPVFA